MGCCFSKQYDTDPPPMPPMPPMVRTRPAHKQPHHHGHNIPRPRHHIRAVTGSPPPLLAESYCIHRRDRVRNGLPANDTSEDGIAVNRRKCCTLACTPGPPPGSPTAALRPERRPVMWMLPDGEEGMRRVGECREAVAWRDFWDEETCRRAGVHTWY